MSEPTTFFISYNHHDRAWAEWIAWELEDKGYKTLIQAWDFTAGSNFVVEMDNAATQANRTIAVLSPAYLASLFTKSEWAAAFDADPTGQKRKLIPIRVAECELTGLLAQRVYIDLVGYDEDTARQYLLTGIQEGRAKPATRSAFPGTVPSEPAPTRPKPTFPANPQTAAPESDGIVSTEPLQTPSPCDQSHPGLTDLPEQGRIDQPERIGPRHEAPPLRPLHPSVYNLPPQLDTFIGREEEIGKWLELLRAPEKRLFTLTGCVGLGKTRLAMALAERSLPYFPDGVLWSEQTQSSTVEMMYDQLAEQLGLSVPRDCSVTERLYHFLHKRSSSGGADTHGLLLVLDNVDQITGAATAVRDLLQAAPGIKVLVTSCRALGVHGETRREINPLPLKDAVELFVKRAQDYEQDFALSAENEADVQELCRHLDGMPLAIELAAVRCYSMTPREIVRNLAKRFDLLQRDHVDPLNRQDTLRRAIDWSYRLLDDESKRIFAQLSVFAGGFTMDDAVAVCRPGGLVEDRVYELRQHSFLRVEPETRTQQMRFLMLESLGKYAAEQLQRADEGCRAVAERHAEYFLRFAQEQVGKYRTAEEITAARVLELQGSNLMAALAWARTAQRPDMEAELRCLIGHRLFRRGFQRQAIAMVQEGLTVLRPLAKQYPLLMADLLRERAGLHLDDGETQEARDLAEEALKFAKQQKDRVAQARAENLLGQIAMTRKVGDYKLARKYFEGALQLVKGTGIKDLIGSIFNNRGIVEMRDGSGDTKAAEQYLNTTQRLRRDAGDRRGQAEALTNLGVLAFSAKQWEQARDHYTEALALLQELQDTLRIGEAFFNLGEVALEMGDPERAVHLLCAAERLLSAEQFPALTEVTQKLNEAAQRAGYTWEEVTRRRDSLQAIPLEDLSRQVFP